MYGTDAGVDTNLPALSCKSSYSYANQYFSRTISITKQKRFVSKKGHRQPHIHSKARVLSPQLKNGLFTYARFLGVNKVFYLRCKNCEYVKSKCL